VPDVGASQVAPDGRQLHAIMATTRARRARVGSVSVRRDVAATIEEQRQLADRARLSGTVLDVVSALVVVLDAKGRIVRFNRACERLSGYGHEAVVGRRIWDVVVPPDEIAGMRAGFDSLKAGQFPNSVEGHWLTISGEQRLIRWENACVCDDHGALTHVVATGIDVTARRRADEKLEYELQLMRGLMENLPAQVYFKDRESRFIGISNHGARTLGLSDPAQAIGKTDFDFFTDEHAQQAYDDEQDIIRTGQARTSEERETRIGVPDKWVETTKLPLRDASHRIVGTFGISVDITDRRKAQQALRDRTRLFAALSQFSVAVNAIQDTARLVAALVDAVSAVVPADTVVITMLDQRDGRYRVKAARGLADGAVGATIEPGVGTSGRAISERVAIFTDSHPRAQATPSLQEYMVDASIRSVGVPLIRDGVVVGVITVGRAETAATFTQAECEVFALLGSHAALALANANLVEEVSALAIHDGLTGLYNRRHFDVALDLAIARFKRRAPAGNLAAIMFDLDSFGEFNRRHGHLAGDTLLREFGQILNNRLRSADIVARYGGEEFVAILEDCGLPEANRLADEVRSELEARSVKGADGRALRATVSAGCAVMHAAEPTKDALLGRADAALYMAKEAGRNRVVAA
jgi:diguanylate cyclase (GGDEF)-like protein/PAS domain S-box-containing protein